MWPLYENALAAADLQSFAPLNYGVLAKALDLGLIDQRALVEGLAVPGFAVAPPSDLLEVFLRTSSEFDRRRDIQEELERLSLADDEKRPPLWMILARLILLRHLNADEALRVLQELFQELGAPEQMAPYTLYGVACNETEPKSAASIVASLASYLSQSGA
jgi:hypothetical protein